MLEALGGYQMIAERFLAGDDAFAVAWNFGPADNDARPASWIVDRMRAEQATRRMGRGCSIPNV